MSNQTLIKTYKGIVGDVQTEIKKLENDTRVLNKLYVILDVLHDVPINEIIKKHDISQGTAYNWIKQWNNGGMEGLKRKKGTKGKSKLTEKQFDILDKTIQVLELKTAKEVQMYIEFIYGVTYSIRQVERIMKKLNYTYTKPYQIYSKMPDDAEDNLRKKTKKVNLTDYTISFLDQSYCQNQDNSQRCYGKKGKKNIKIQPTEKISVNAVGVQSINGKSFISFLKNTRTFEMMKFMITIIIENSNNEKLKFELNEIINDDKLRIENILTTINQEEHYWDLLYVLELLSPKSKTITRLYNRLKKTPMNFKTKSKKVLEDLQKVMLFTLIFNEELQHKLHLEKPHAIILDNYGVHLAVFFTELCKILNIKLIPLPPYSPKYNPIEQVWRTIKAIISRKYITTEDKLKKAFKTEFEKVVDNKSYWIKWVEKFL